MATNDPVLVVGGTRGTGLLIARLLLQRGYRVRVLARDPARRVEDEIRASGLDYTIIRVGFLLNGQAGQRAVEVGQGALPLAPRHRIPRADVAEAFAEALQHPRSSRATFEIVSGKGRRREAWSVLLGRLQPDA